MQSKNDLSYQSFVKRRARQFFPFLMTDTVKNWTLNVEGIFARQKFILQDGFDYFRLRQTHGQSLKDIEFSHQNALESFWRDLLPIIKTSDANTRDTPTDIGRSQLLGSDKD